MNLEELEKKVQLQEDIQEIENLQKLYGHYFDLGMFEEVMSLFSDNVESVEITDHGVFRGKDSVKRMYSGMVSRDRPGWMFFEVMQSQGVITVAPDGKTATGRWYTPAFECRPFGGTVKQTWEFGVYDNKYIR
jgi:hypothetical protein